MTASCPADDVLQRLLANGMSEAEEAALEAHVAACISCQRQLDLLTARAGMPTKWGECGVSTPKESLEQCDRERSRGLIDPACEPPATPAKGKPRFTVLRQHAEGGLGRVYLARDEQLHRTVALKEIRPERADDSKVRQRFLNEAEITGQLEHPGIVPIYALENDDAGRPVYAMRFIQGRTLRDAIKSHHQRPTPLGLHELLRQFVSVCRTIAYAHSRQVIHRDLKPENVMVGDYGETLVVDWGLAKRLGDADPSFVTDSAVELATESVNSSSAARLLPDRTMIISTSLGEQLTEAGQLLGTPAFMAPEQARGEMLTPAADIYALGAVLYELLAGKPPYHGKNSVDILRKVIAGAPAELTGVPRALNAICRKAMAREAQERFGSAADLARDLDRWLAGEPVSACREHWLERAGRWIRRHRTLATSLSVASILLLIIAAGVGWWREHLAEERRFENDRQRLQIDALLDRCEAAVKENDAAGAQLAIGDAERHADSLRSGRPADRLAQCRSAADLLGELEQIEDQPWDYESGKFQGPQRAVREWPEAFNRIGVTAGQTSVEEAVRAVHSSLARERLLGGFGSVVGLRPRRRPNRTGEYPGGGRRGPIPGRSAVCGAAGGLDVGEGACCPG